MVQVSFKPFKAKTLRLTRLDGCCTPPAPEDPCTKSVFNSLVMVSISAEVEDGEEFFELTANGDICLNERNPDILKYLTVSLELCRWQPEDLEMMLAWPTVSDASGVAVGNDVMEGINENELGIELWTGVGGVSCATGQRFGFITLPCTKGWQIDGSLDFASAGSNVKLTGYTSGTHGWGTGPYDVVDIGGGVPGQHLVPIPQGAHARVISTTVAPPPQTAGCVPLLG